MTATASLDLTITGKDGQQGRTLDIGTLVIAGWTGRNKEAMEKHIAELEAIGIARPKSMPIYYRVAAPLLTTADEIQVSGDRSSGEVEAVIFQADGERFVGLGSDHTDRHAETINVSLSKQMCAKPVAPVVWRWAEIADHWDELVLRAWVHEAGQRSLYQEGPVTTMRHPDDLIGGYGGLEDGAAMFCGTLAVQGEIRPANAFEMELEDPVRGLKINHAYAVTALPVEG